MECDLGLVAGFPSGGLYFVRLSRAKAPPKKRTLDGSFAAESGPPRKGCWMSQNDPCRTFARSRRYTLSRFMHTEGNGS